MNKERWAIARGSAEVDGQLAVGSKVTLYGKMSAERIDVKAPATAPGAGKDKK